MQVNICSINEKFKWIVLYSLIAVSKSVYSKNSTKVSPLANSLAAFDKNQPWFYYSNHSLSTVFVVKLQ